jgi:hypothetical protein
MNTKSAAAAVTGARHLRTGRNGQDAAAAWSRDDAGAIVVCDGCSAGAASEVGARIASQVAIATIVQALVVGVPPDELWSLVRARVIVTLERVLAELPDRERAVHDHFLFTIVAAARRGDSVSVWAVGDGGYAVGDRERVLGPFPDNQPPYLGYELLGTSVAEHRELADAYAGALVVGSDGACELGLAQFAAPRFVEHPDALRRELARQARTPERIDWEARRIDRRPAALQDDGAVAVLRWRA